MAAMAVLQAHQQSPTPKFGQAGRFLLDHDNLYPSISSTMTVQEQQSLPALTRQIKELLCGSLLLSTAVAMLSFVNLGRLSVLMAPIAFFLTAIHHSILLYLLRRQDRNETDSETKKLTLPATASTAGLVTFWILILLWSVVVLAVVIISVMVVSGNAYETWERLAGYFEIPLEVAEACLLVVLTFKCKKQRRRTLAQLSADNES